MGMPGLPGMPNLALHPFMAGARRVPCARFAPHPARRDAPKRPPCTRTTTGDASARARLPFFSSLACAGMGMGPMGLPGMLPPPVGLMPPGMNPMAGMASPGAVPPMPQPGLNGMHAAMQQQQQQQQQQQHFQQQQQHFMGNGGMMPPGGQHPGAMLPPPQQPQQQQQQQAQQQQQQGVAMDLGAFGGSFGEFLQGDGGPGGPGDMAALLDMDAGDMDGVGAGFADLVGGPGDGGGGAAGGGGGEGLGGGKDPGGMDEVLDYFLKT